MNRPPHIHAMKKHLRHYYYALLAAALFLPASPAMAQIQSQTEIGSLQRVTERLFNVLLIFFPAVAVIYLALSGYRYIIAQGQPDLIEKAKKSLTYAIFGAIIAFGSVLIISVVGHALGFTTGLKI